jgi:3-dehydroquinate synthetase
MRIESRIGEILGVTDEGTSERLAALLEACGLDRPVEEEFTAERVLEAAQADKKVRGSVLRCVLLGRIGRVSQAAGGGWAHELPPDGALELLRAALRSQTRGADSD